MQGKIQLAGDVADAMKMTIVTQLASGTSSERERRELSPMHIDCEYSAAERLTDGTAVRLRLLRPSDRDALVAGFKLLSPESRYRRFFTRRRGSRKRCSAD